MSSSTLATMPVNGRSEVGRVTVVALDGLAVGAQFGHGGAKGAEVIDHGLVDQHITVGQIQDAFLHPRFHSRQMIWKAV
jgi:hypothetical protein